MIKSHQLKSTLSFICFYHTENIQNIFSFLNESFFFRLKICCRLIITSSRKIDSFLKKKSVNTVNADAVNNVNTNVADMNITDAVNVVNSSEIVDSVRSFKNTDVVSTVNTKNVANNSKDSSALHGPSSASHASLLPEKPHHPPKEFIFSKTKIGSRNQHKWFNDYPCLHYDLDKNKAFCFYCMKHSSKLTTEKNKNPAFITAGFKSWHKALECFKDHQNSKCHRGAATFEVIVPSCSDPSTMMSE